MPEPGVSSAGSARLSLRTDPMFSTLTWIAAADGRAEAAKNAAAKSNLFM